MRAVVSHATPNDVPTIVNFTRAARIDMFPMVDALSHDEHANRELATFEQTYLDHPDGAFLIARVNGLLVATIAYVPYDYRFPQLHLGQGRTVEVVRLYVDPAFRRTGLASQLFAALAKTARERGVEQMYLHTHPFLAGAVRFWEKSGFSIMHVEDDPVWQTTHMKLTLDGKDHVPKARARAIM
ncbi:hypothetical protein VUR80DRAFT_4911 [Thermomyces stellatus]